MPIPDYRGLLLPALKALADGSEVRLRNITGRLAESFPPEEVRQVISSGQSRLANRTGWAVFCLQRAGLVERIRHGVYRITDDGRKLLDRSLARITLDTLREYPKYVEWENGTKPAPPPNGEPPEETPDETLDRVAGELQNALETDVLDRVRNAPPAFFERVVVDLLLAMGYGGGDAARGQVIGGPGDEGIDGVIREDVLGLDEVYVQAKRYAPDNSVGTGHLLNFAGAIDATGTTKGVFVTTSSFSDPARAFVAKSPKRIVLIDGAELARLMVEHGIGVRPRIRYEIKRIDEDYFDPEGL